MNGSVYLSLISIIYAYDITRAYKYRILPYRMRVSLIRKYEYSNIRKYPTHVYHVVCFPHYWENVCKVTYRTINTVCEIYYACLSTGTFSVIIMTPHNPTILSYAFPCMFVLLGTLRISCFYRSPGYVYIPPHVMYPLCCQYTQLYPESEFYACIYS